MKGSERLELLRIINRLEDVALTMRSENYNTQSATRDVRSAIDKLQLLLERGRGPE